MSVPSIVKEIGIEYEKNHPNQKVKIYKGIEEIKETILNDFSLSDLGNKDLTYLSNTRQISLVKSSLNKIENVIKQNTLDIPVDMLAIDIKSAWEDLGKVIGDYYEDELVDNIFQRFCLGK